MKTIVIGHSSGIGKALCEGLQADGISLSNGFDMDVPTEYNFRKYDVIILNAYSKFGSQLNLMFKIAEEMSVGALLIVIGSVSAFRTNPSDIDRAKYSSEKLSIMKAGRDLISMGYNVSVVSPGTVDTPRNKQKQTLKLKTTDVFKTVENVINNFKNEILIEHCVIRAKRK